MKISRTFELAMGHRLQYHQGKCQNYHGHNYMITVELDGAVQGDMLPNTSVNPEAGMVIDFSRLKVVVADVLAPFDHAMVLHYDDPLRESLQRFSSKLVSVGFEPTAENLAHHWLSLIEQKMRQVENSNRYSITIRVRETSDTEVVAE